MKTFPKIADLSFDWFAKEIMTGMKVDKKTKIASMGSCFATEIKQYFIKNGYNYLQAEADKNPWIDIFPGDKGRHKSYYASCAWERVYTTANMLQIFNSILGKKENRLHKDPKGIYDLMRTRMIYPDLETAYVDIEDHERQAHEVLENADLLILTLGLVELWEDDGFVIAGSPKGMKIEGDFKFRVSTVSENIRNLEGIYNLMKILNPSIKIMVTVSPVHLRATFRNDVDIVSASCFSKSTLRAAADEFVKNHSDVYYYPSYEIATILLPMMKLEAYDHDHHITERTIKIIMALFEKSCIKK